MRSSTDAKSWRRNWARVIHSSRIRRRSESDYTTNATESLNMSLRKVSKARGSIPTMRRW